jgi:tetratricopeptide (TPR) repeat protein
VRHLRAILNCGRLRFATMMADADVLIGQDEYAHTGYLLRGAARLFAEQPAHALDDLEWARQRNPGEETSWHLTLIGEGRFRNKDYEKAAETYAGALTLDPNLVPARFGRARCHFHAREYLAAIDDLTGVIDRDSGFADAYILRGECFDKLARYDESTQDYDRANELLGGSTLMAFNIWRAQAMKEEKEQAASVEEDDQERDPSGLEEGGELHPGDDFFERYLKDRLRTDATPDHDPRRPVSPPEGLG